MHTLKSLLKAFACLMMIGSVSVGVAQDRETKVRSDQSKIEEAGKWLYNDLATGFQQAKETGKPLLVVMRCVPCEACAQLDEQVVKRDKVLQTLMDQFVCVRIIATNGMDLHLLQYDYDQSWAALMLNADKTIYGRYGTRSHETRSEDDVSVEGFADALRYALKWHEEYQDDRSVFAGKTGPKAMVDKPEQFANFAGKYSDKLDYEGKVVQSCIHCHQVGESMRLAYRNAGKPVPEQLLYPYPNPKIFGLVMDPKKASTVRRVTDGSQAEQLKIQRGDRIAAVDGQPVLSTADIQWVLHHTEKTSLPVVIEREGKTFDVNLDLPTGWRRQDDISWRATSWDLRRMVTGGLKLQELKENQKAEQKIAPDKLALVVKHVGQYGEHAVAKKAGFLEGDVIVETAGQSNRMSESDLMGHLMETTKPGDQIEVKVLRNGKELLLTLLMQ